MIDQVRPDYLGASVHRIIPALLGDADRSWLPEEARRSNTAVVLLLDGLGWNLLNAHRDLLPEMTSLEGGVIKTVVPSTTPTVLASISTGLAPIEHGLLGFRMRWKHGVLNVLRWQMENGDAPPDPMKVQPHPAFGGRSVAVVTKSEFRDGGFSRAHLAGAHFEGWVTISMLIERCRRLIQGGREIVFAYYAGIDMIAHLRGLQESFFTAELSFADWLVGALRDVLPKNCALIVTSDHGQVPLTRDSWIPVDHLEEMIELQAGDARMRHLFAREGAAHALLDAARASLDKHAWVYSREEALDEELFGPVRPSESVEARIGHVILAAREPVGFIDPALPQEVRLRSGHGSLTADEMLVPLLAGSGRG
jgi:type I phosphodiesterase/nucleotide pyrophosphatase